MASPLTQVTARVEQSATLLEYSLLTALFGMLAVDALVAFGKTSLPALGKLLLAW